MTKRNLNCWNVFCQHISLVSCSCFCDKEGVFCIFVIVCTFLFVTQTVYCPVNKGVSFTETQTKLALQNAGSCRCNTCTRRRKCSKSSQVASEDTDGRLELLQTRKRTSNFCFNGFKKCIRVMKSTRRLLGWCNHISHVCFLLLHVRIVGHHSSTESVLSIAG